MRSFFFTQHSTTAGNSSAVLYVTAECCGELRTDAYSLSIGTHTMDGAPPIGQRLGVEAEYRPTDKVQGRDGLGHGSPGH